MILEGYEVPKEDRGTFVKVMALVAHSDGVVSLEEREAIGSIVQAWDLDAQTAAEVTKILDVGEEIEVLVKMFNSKKAGLLLLQELVTLAKLDGSYSRDEQSTVSWIAELMEVSPSRLVDIESWVDAGIQWRQAGLSLLEPEATI